MSKYSIEANISFPNHLFEFIERDRGDVARSRYVVRILEKALQKSDRYRAYAKSEAEK